MPRTAAYTVGDLLDGAQEIVASGGPRALTIEGLSAATGAPIGSIYHRFPSRAVLAAQLWIRAVERFQVGLIAGLEAPVSIESGVRAALYTLRWSRRNSVAARILLLYRDADFVDETLPEPWAARIAGLNLPLLEALNAYTRRLYGSVVQANLRRVGLAIIDIPYGAVHRHLAVGKPLPAELDALVAEAAEAVLSRGARR
jgi:AcrR family transcriptional regulator